MTFITDDFMREMMPKARTYSLVILKTGPNWLESGADKIIWEHGRRNFSLRADGILSIVCPVRDGGDIHGLGIFNATVDETVEIMDDDPGVRAGVFVYEVHPCRGFPGDALPATEPPPAAKT
jgi:hypothetical protein